MGVGVGRRIAAAAGVAVFDAPTAIQVQGRHPLLERLQIADIGERIGGLVHWLASPNIGGFSPRTRARSRHR